MGVLGKIVKDQCHCSGGGLAAWQDRKNSENLERLLQESQLKRLHNIPHLILELFHSKIKNFIEVSRSFLTVKCKHQNFPMNISISATDVPLKLFIGFDSWPCTEVFDLVMTGEIFQVTVPGKRLALIEKKDRH
jgi:hypothetical protein